jgi:hypothetical protein
MFYITQEHTVRKCYVENATRTKNNGTRVIIYILYCFSENYLLSAEKSSHDCLLGFEFVGFSWRKQQNSYDWYVSIYFLNHLRFCFHLILPFICKIFCI